MPDTVNWARILELAAKHAAGLTTEAPVVAEMRELLRQAPAAVADAELLEYNPAHTPPVIQGEFSTGIPMLDTFLNGGTRRGELAYVSAPAKDGKTTFLITVGAHLLRTVACTLLHCTLEIYPPEVHQRYSESLLRRPLQAITPEQLTALGGELRGKLFITDLVGQPTIEAVEETVEKVKPDVLIVDYGDLLHTRSDNRFTEVGLVWEHLRRIGRVHNCAVWTAGRINREGQEAESYLKAYNCDVHLILQVDPTSASRGLANLVVAEIRRGSGRWETVPIIYSPESGFIGGGL